MLRYILTRLLYMIPVLWLVVSVVFLLIHLVPGDPVEVRGRDVKGDPRLGNPTQLDGAFERQLERRMRGRGARQ